MTETNPIPRQLLTASPAEIGLLLPGLGRVMVTLAGPGIRHERLGRVAHVVRKADALCLGDEARLALAAVRRVVLDRTSRMRDQAYPRIDLHRADGSYICGIVGFDGLEPFDNAIAAFDPSMSALVQLREMDLSQASVLAHPALLRCGRAVACLTFSSERHPARSWLHRSAA
jgi:hypothetical protein